MNHNYLTKIVNSIQKIYISQNNIHTQIQFYLKFLYHKLKKLKYFSKKILQNYLNLEILDQYGIMNYKFIHYLYTEELNIPLTKIQYSLIKMKIYSLYLVVLNLKTNIHWILNIQSLLFKLFQL